jgi:hypothetical protein
MADDLDERLNDNNSDNLESKVNNSDSHSNPEVIEALEERAKKRKPRGLFGKIMDYTIAAGAVAASYALIGPMALVANAISLVATKIVNYKRKRDTPSRQIRNNAIMASLFSIPGYYAFKWMNRLIDVTTWSGLATRFAVQNFAYVPAMMLAGNTVGYPLVFGTTKGMFKYGIRDLGWRNYKTGTKYFSWPNLAAARFLPDYTHFPLSLGMRVLWGTTAGARYLHEADPYKYEHKIIDGKPVNGANKEYKKAA